MHVVFNEQDVIRGLERDSDVNLRRVDGNTSKKARGNIQKAVRALDVLQAWCQSNPLNKQKIVKLQTRIALPDTKGVSRPLCDLYAGNDLPTAIAPFGMPPLLHPRLSAHPLFERRGLKIPRYKLETFFEKADFESHTEAERRRFRRWLHKHWKKVPVSSWRYLAVAPIWPARGGSLHPISELCQPRNSRVAQVLSEVLHLPRTDVLDLRVIRSSGRGKLILRRAPSQSEVATFYRRLSSFPLDRRLYEYEVADFHGFENELAILAKDRDVCRLLKQMPGLGISRDRFLKPIGELHRAENHTIRTLFLLPCDLLDRPNHSLDLVFPPGTEPAPEAIILALTSDGTRTGALIPRLQCFTKAAKNRANLSLAEVPCIPNEGKLLPPARLAFKGDRADYWGEWKIALSYERLGADVQGLYRSAGVTSEQPGRESSHAFFRWLNDQPVKELPRYLAPVIRHLIHPNGVSRWWEEDPCLGCIPVAVGREMRLVGLRALIHRDSQVFYPTFLSWRTPSAMRAETKGRC
jgi:hypothetical protein